MMKRQLLLMALMLSVVEAPALAKTLPGGDILQLGIDARTLGLAEASLASGRGPSAAAHDPLALLGTGPGAFSFSRAFLLSGISLNHFAYARAAGPLGLGFSATRLDYGTLDERDAAGTLTGGYHPQDTVLQAGAAGTFRDIGLGLSVKWLNSRIVKSAHAVAFDAAARMPISPDVTAAVALRNFGTKLKFEDESAPLPAAGAAGVSWKALEALRVDAAVEKPLYAPVWVALGAEYTVKTGEAATAFLRGGVNTRTPELGGLAGLHMGAGLAWRSMSVDYSFDPFGELGDTHRVSVGYKW